MLLHPRLLKFTVSALLSWSPLPPHTLLLNGEEQYILVRTLAILSSLPQSHDAHDSVGQARFSPDDIHRAAAEPNRKPQARHPRTNSSALRTANCTVRNLRAPLKEAVQIPGEAEAISALCNVVPRAGHVPPPKFRRCRHRQCFAHTPVHAPGLRLRTVLECRLSMAGTRSLVASSAFAKSDLRTRRVRSCSQRLGRGPSQIVIRGVDKLARAMDAIAVCIIPELSFFVEPAKMPAVRKTLPVGARFGRVGVHKYHSGCSEYIPEATGDILTPYSDLSGGGELDPVDYYASRSTLPGSGDRRGYEVLARRERAAAYLTALAGTKKQCVANKTGRTSRGDMQLSTHARRRDNDVEDHAPAAQRQPDDTRRASAKHTITVASLEATEPPDIITSNLETVTNDELDEDLGLNRRNLTASAVTQTMFAQAYDMHAQA
ncbi:hypothetical protein B0H21DRAFT_705135 [Amylocystis lapponica]|nr:hypothetical protein B0H21DRAFT_705135 [Amylocystis lapponica]